MPAEKCNKPHLSLIGYACSCIYLWGNPCIFLFGCQPPPCLCSPLCLASSLASLESSAGSSSPPFGFLERCCSASCTASDPNSIPKNKLCRDGGKPNELPARKPKSRKPGTNSSNASGSLHQSARLHSRHAEVRVHQLDELSLSDKDKKLHIRRRHCLRHTFDAATESAKLITAHPLDL
jgi:hypothetical protein